MRRRIIGIAGAVIAAVIWFAGLPREIVADCRIEEHAIVCREVER